MSHIEARQNKHWDRPYTWLIPVLFFSFFYKFCIASIPVCNLLQPVNTCNNPDLGSPIKTNGEPNSVYVRLVLSRFNINFTTK